MEKEEIVGLIVLLCILTAYLIFYVFALSATYSVESPNHKDLVLSNAFRSYRIVDYDDNGVWIEFKKSTRYINAKRITHFWLVSFINEETWFKEYDNKTPSGKGV